MTERKLIFVREPGVNDVKVWWNDADGNITSLTEHDMNLINGLVHDYNRVTGDRKPIETRPQIDPWQAIQFVTNGFDGDVVTFLNDVLHNDMMTIAEHYPQFITFCEIDDALDEAFAARAYREYENGDNPAVRSVPIAAPICQAKQLSDTMKCDHCRLTWDINTNNPPDCHMIFKNTSRTPYDTVDQGEPFDWRRFLLWFGVSCAVAGAVWFVLDFIKHS